MGFQVAGTADHEGLAFPRRHDLYPRGLGTSAFHVQVAEGAPFDMSVTLSVQVDSLSTSMIVSVAGGALESSPIAIPLEGDGDVTVSVQAASFPEGTHIGIQTGLGESLTLSPDESEVTNTPATGAPIVSGTAQVGQTLTADTSGIADADGLTNVTYSYQWISNDGTTDTDIADATASTYVVASGEVGKTIKFRVTITDDAGNAESLTSEATEAVVLGGL